MPTAIKNLLQASAIFLVAFFVGQLIPRSQATTLSKNAHNIKRVEYQEVKSAIENKSAIIFDARAESNFKASHIPNAISLPVNSSSSEIEQALKTAKAVPDSLIIAYCADAACPDSHTLATKLSTAGQNNVAVYQEGWEEWHILEP